MAQNLHDDAALSAMVVTDDLTELTEAVDRYAQSGVTHLSIHQVAPDPHPFLQAAADVLIQEG